MLEEVEEKMLIATLQLGSSRLPSARTKCSENSEERSPRAGTGDLVEHFQCSPVSRGFTRPWFCLSSCSGGVAVAVLQLRKVKLREVTCPKIHGWCLNLCLTLKLMLFLLLSVAGFLGEWDVSRAKARIR